MVTISIMVGNGPYSAERPYTALRFAYTALINDHKVKMFFFEDGVFDTKKNQNPSQIYSIEEWVKKCLEENAEIYSCGVCLKARGIDPTELIEGVKVGTMENALNNVLDSEKQLFF